MCTNSRILLCSCAHTFTKISVLWTMFQLISYEGVYRCLNPASITWLETPDLPKPDPHWLEPKKFLPLTPRRGELCYVPAADRWGFGMTMIWNIHKYSSSPFSRFCLNPWKFYVISDLFQPMGRLPLPRRGFKTPGTNCHNSARMPVVAPAKRKPPSHPRWTYSVSRIDLCCAEALRLCSHDCSMVICCILTCTETHT